MRKFGYIIILMCLNNYAVAQDSLKTKTFQYRGMAVLWGHLNTNNNFSFYTGGRYIPQLNIELPTQQKGKFDFELSANLYANYSIMSFDTTDFNSEIRPYRAWVRYSTEQLELRFGLQKIDFGTATMLRALRWFDQIDPRDPLKLTNGVWGGLFRYYFLNNMNIWTWVLYQNKDLKGIETMNSEYKIPEFGGRFQTPALNGELGLSYHHRNIDTSSLSGVYKYKQIAENRVGIDAKWDFIVGIWLEASWTTKSENIGNMTNQELLTFGTDYTFGIGNGINTTVEYMLMATDNKPFAYEKTNNLTAFSINYPIGIFDNISYIVYYDINNKNFYNFINWQRTFNLFTINTMAYWNPKNNYSLSFNNQGKQNIYQGFGIQLMVSLNH